MIPWNLLDSAKVPGTGGELRLFQRGHEFSIRIVGQGELMNSRAHGSEDALATLTCARLSNTVNPQVLIGGLGMGFTLAAALQQLNAEARVVVAELVPAVVNWNKGPMGELAGQPLSDARVTVREGDVARILKSERQTYDAILLDVDNGPEGFTREENDWLYDVNGLTAAYEALRPRGVLAVWSAGPVPDFMDRLRKIGFDADEVRVHAHGNKGTRHVIWFGRREM
jgi:spermidine synthase